MSRPVVAALAVVLLTMTGVVPTAATAADRLPRPTPPPAWVELPAPPPACPPPSVRVHDAAGLRVALGDAGPGTVIALADGVYRGRFTVRAQASLADRAWLCGGPDAVLDGGDHTRGYGLHLEGASGWVLQGFTVTRSMKGVMIDGSTGVTVRGLTVHTIGDEAVHLRKHTTDSVVVGNLISDTGLRRAEFGEGVYVGSAVSNWCALTACEPDRSDRNAVVDNVIHSTSGEALDIKEGTTGGVASGNLVDGARLTGTGPDSWIAVKGNDWSIRDNIGRRTPRDGIQVSRAAPGWGERVSVHRNHGRLDVPNGLLVRVGRGASAVVGCSNALDGGPGRAFDRTCGPDVVPGEEPRSADATFVTQAPQRVVDDRTVAPGRAVCVPVRGVAGVAADATGVIVSVTTVRPSGSGYAVVFPDSRDGRTPLPVSSTVNFEPGQDVANSTFVALPENGRLCYATVGAARAGVLIDVAGYTRSGSGVVTRDPVRILDTRPGPGHAGPVVGPVRNGTVHTLDVVEAAHLPPSATGVLVNVTVTEVAAPGHLRVFPAGMAAPDISTVNYAVGKDKASASVVALSKDGSIAFASFSTGRAHVVLDVVGYVEDGAALHAVTPARVLDTRPAPLRVGEVAGPVRTGDVTSLALRRKAGVPEEATGVVLTVTAVAPTGLGHLRVWPDVTGRGATPPPDASWINYVLDTPARAIPTMVVTALPDEGGVNLGTFQTGGRVHLIVDVVGYVTG